MSPRLTRAGRPRGNRPRVPAWAGSARTRIARLRTLGVRVRTLTGGMVLAGMLLLALALVGGVSGVVGDRPEAPESTHSGVGPLTAVQPALRQALLTEAELSERSGPDATPEAEPSSAARPDAAADAVPPTVMPAGEETASGRDEQCEHLLGDALAGLWEASPPQETTTRHTPRGGGVLDQLIGVFDANQATEAYRRLRETAAGCDRAATTLDGRPVTVLLEELGPAREESGSEEPNSDREESTSEEPNSDREESTSADEGYATWVVLEGEQRTLTGWLAVDRLGPVISVLRHLEPAEAAAEQREGDPDPAEVRLAALDKLRALLRALGD